MIVDVVYGFLGAGKTTFISRVLQRWGSRERIVVLVNEFGEVGIDGELLQGQGGNVLEMPSGCICCTLQADFRSQILELSRTLRPERLIIEPTGVATIAQIRSIVEAQLFEDTIREVHDILVADATGFLDLYKANRHFVESQVRNAQLVLLNKCDRVDRTRALLIRDAIAAIQPGISALMTEFGIVDWDEYRAAFAAAAPVSPGEGAEGPGLAAPAGAGAPEAGPGVHLEEEADALGFESVGYDLDGLTFDRGALEGWFRLLGAPDARLGEVVRAKGLFQVGSQWLLLELASGELTVEPLPKGTRSRVSVIGRGLDRTKIEEALHEAVSEAPAAAREGET